MTRRTVDRSVALGVGVLAVLAVVVVYNALVYPALAGFDFRPDLAYATDLIRNGKLPDRVGSYYTPPGFFALGGLAYVVGESLGLVHPERLGQLMNGAFVVATAGLVFIWARTIFPRRPVLHLSALAFFVVSPLALKSGAMFHPEPLSMLLATGALVAASRFLSRPRRSLGWAGLGWALAIGLLLGLQQLVRAFALWTVVVVALMFVVTCVAVPASRRQVLGALAVVLAVGAIVPAPWYAYQQSQYGNPVFDRPQPTASLWERRPARFYVDAGLPDLVVRPFRPHASDRLIPVAYGDLWGDYWGVWSWNSALGSPSASDRHRLITQVVAGAPLTVLALAGWISVAFLLLRAPAARRELVPVVLMPLAALAGMAYFALAYPTADGDTIKASFMLTALPAWALCFGFATDVLARRLGRNGSRALLAIGLLLAVLFLDYGLASSNL